MIRELSVWKNKYPLCSFGGHSGGTTVFFHRCFFISLTKVLLPVRNLLTEDGEIVCLIKPQFEAGREKVGKKGVVRDPAVHLEVIEKVMAYAMSIDWSQIIFLFPRSKDRREISSIFFISKETGRYGL